MRDGVFAELVFTLVDVTQQLEQDRLQQLHRELPLIVRQLLRDREGFQAFVAETAGQVTIESRVEGAEFVIAVEDDGRGVDWQAICQRAERRGLPATTERDLIDALFTDGISTRDVISDISGRGVGLSAVPQVCQQLGGTIHVDSRPGQGTRFEFRFVLSTLVDAPHIESSAHAM